MQFLLSWINLLFLLATNGKSFGFWDNDVDDAIGDVGEGGPPVAILKLQ